MQQREAVRPPDERTRVDITPAAYEDALRRTAFVADPADYRPRPIRKTVYVTLNRPGVISNEGWRALSRSVTLVWSAGAAQYGVEVVGRFTTDLDVDHPAILWVLLVRADAVVPVQEQLTRVMRKLPPSSVSLVWSEAVPRTLHVERGVA